MTDLTPASSGGTATADGIMELADGYAGLIHAITNHAGFPFPNHDIGVKDARAALDRAVRALAAERDAALADAAELRAAAEEVADHASRLNYAGTPRLYCVREDRIERLRSALARTGGE